MALKKTILSLFLWLAFVSSTFSNDSLYQKDFYFQKLIKTKTEIPVFYNEDVKATINLMLRNYSSKTSIIIGKTQHYYNLYFNDFKKAGIPVQLLLLMAANSESNTLHSSIDGATGLWNISYITAKKYGLVTNSYVDERKNPEKSTKVAIQYLKDLQNIYQDWLKTIVAFKIGPINLNKAIHKNIETLQYSKIHNNLNLDQQNAIVNYMAIWYIWHYFSEHKIIPTSFKTILSDTVHIEREISFSTLSFHLNINEDILKNLNPELRLNIVPVFYNQVGLKLPKDKKTIFYEKYLEIFPPIIIAKDTLNFDSLYLNYDSAAVDSILKSRINEKLINKEDSKKTQVNENDEIETIYYTVKKGDGLILLADIFDCTVNDIKNWNKIKKNTITKGQKLKIIVPKKKVAQYKKINNMTLKQKQQLAKKK